MRDSVVYINHLNQSVTLGDASILLNENSIRDYSWKYDSLYSKIINLKKEIYTFSIPITIISENKEEVANSLFEIFEKDILSFSPGALWIGDYYIQGFMIAKKNKNFVYNRIMDITLTFVTDSKFWRKNTKFVFRLNNSSSTEDGLGFPYDYPYDFLSPISIQNLNNTSYVASDFIMVIYGSISNPAIAIAENTYQVNCDVGSNEYLTINSKDRTIILTESDGTKTNKFAYRDTSAGNIFEKIPTGTCSVSMATDCNLDITIIEERSEPEWI
jgi:hypothetical protein